MRQTTLLGVGVATLFACSAPEPRDESAAAQSSRSTLRVYVVNYPLQYFAERIGGDLVEVQFPAPPGLDPAFWSPDAEDVAAYQSADLIVLNGASYARWADRVSLPASKLVNSSADFSDDFIFIESGITHTHGPAGEHSHGEVAFTTWLDPTLAVEQARAISDAFAAAWPEQQAAFQQGFEALRQDLLNLDEALLQLAAGSSEKPLLASHPVYQYLARRYELDLVAVHFEPDEHPDQRDWSELEQLLLQHPAKWMLWEGAPLDETEKKLEELGIESVVFDPAANLPSDGGDYLTVMRGNLTRLERVFTAKD